ncbi:MAG: DUF4149 domain-containing protein [Gammaproteobacteria bacterium]|nr:DUF4149 domain-containing protein [Gammaproteobacteria bacterium]
MTRLPRTRLEVLAGSLERVLLTAWVGGLWIIGFAVAPTLFRHLPSASAGDIAGELFQLIHGFGLLAAAAALLVMRVYGRWRGVRPILLLLMSVLTVAALLAGQQVTDLRAEPVLDAAFDRWHGISMGLYALLCLLGLVLVAVPARSDE